jgi:FixJ family two-component response regulator
MIPAGARVYVVDDDASFVRSALRLLASWEIQAEGFTSALDFLARGPDVGPACALVDLRMPGVNGLDVLEVLVEEGARLPVVLMSGHTDAESRVAALRSGAVDFVTKPVAEERLLAALERAFAEEAEAKDGAARDAGRPDAPPRRPERERFEPGGLAEPGFAP